MLCSDCQSYCEYSLQFSDLLEKRTDRAIFCMNIQRRARTGSDEKEPFWFSWKENVSTPMRFLIISIISRWEKDVNNIQSGNLFFVNMVQNSKVEEGGFLGKTERKEDKIFSRF